MIRQIFSAVTLAVGVFSTSAADIEIREPGFVFKADKGVVTVCDNSGERLLEINKLRIGWGAPQYGLAVSAEKVGGNQVKVTYRTEKDPENKVAFGALYTVKPEGINAVYTLTAPGEFNVGGTQLTVKPIGKTRKAELFKSGLWTRHANGGVPYEVRDGYFRAFRGKSATLWMEITGNHDWNDTYEQHLNFRKKEKDSNVYSAETNFFVTPAGFDGAAAAARFRGRPLSMELSTAKPFNWFETGSDVPFKLAVTNTSGNAFSGATVMVVARDFDGKKVIEEEKLLTAAPGETETFEFALPGAERNIFFIEAAVKGGVFTRTNVAVLPSCQYKYRSESNIAMSAYFGLPTLDDAFTLMKRLGVAEVRDGDNAYTSKFGIRALAHDNVPSDIGPEAWKKKLDAMVATVMKRGNPAFEFGNEWNMKAKEEKERRAKIYAGLVRDLVAARDAKKADFRIISMGVAGGDTEFFRMMHKYGAWEFFDAIAYHPGRGNTTPDYPGDGWTYYGTIRRVKEMNRELGEKPIYLSEVYASSNPNDWWKDTERQAAENVVLTFAIGLAEGMKSVEFYQLHDAVWHDKGGVNEKDSEYHYGLLNRDNSFKPSAMAFAAIAEALDGAKFIRYYQDGKVNGMLFDTPKGDLAILYDRTDGYFLSNPKNDAEKKNWAHSEPWTDGWKTHRRAAFDAPSGKVTVVDPVGRKKEIPAQDGKVALELSGAPVMVYGLELK